MDIINRIGAAAALEQLAEECTELAQAALKYRRVIEGKNPTPTNKENAIAAIEEETADVFLLINMLGVSDRAVAETIYAKTSRWQERLHHHYHGYKEMGE
jgi:NTP pyrophosphatase (non-canonical NTP hydrolase)